MNAFSGRRAAACSARLYEWLLLLYPASFRRDFGRDMAHLFGDLSRDALQQRGYLGLLLLWQATFKEAAVTAFNEHLSEWRKDMQARQRIATLIGLVFLIYSGSFAALNVLKYNLGVQLPFDPFAGLTDSASPTLWIIAWNGLIILGPVLAFALFLLPSLKMKFDFAGDERITVSFRKGSRLGLILMGASLLLFGLFCLYFIGENFACLTGEQLSC